MEVIREDEDANPQSHRDINGTSYVRSTDDTEAINGSVPPAVTRRKTKRSFSTPGIVEHLHDDHHHDHGFDNDHHHDDDVPLLGDDEDWARRRLSVPCRLPEREVTAESLGLRTYRLRFYILSVFCMVTFVNGMICYMFISIAKTVEFVYDLSDSEIFLLQNCAAIGFLLGVWPCCWLLERSGLRWSVIMAASVQFVGALLKIPIIFNPQTARWSFIGGTLLASLGGPLSLVAPTFLSSIWFPMQERAMSTALGAYSIGLGIGFIVVVEPYFLTIDVRNATPINTSQPITNGTEHHRQILFDDMLLIFYMQLGVTAFCLLLTILYFPNKPPTPPTLSAGTERIDIWQGLKKLLKSSDYHAMVVINIQYSIGMSYQSALDVLLQPLGFAETDIGIMGGLMLVCGTVSACLGGWLGYFFNKRLKLVMGLLFLFSGFPIIWFALTVLGYLPPHKVLVYASVIMSGVGLNAPAALFFEAVIEQTYPVGEAVSIGWMCFIGNLVRSVLFALPLLPGIGIRWVNWLMIGVAFLPMPMLFLYKQKYKRLDLDLTVGDSTVSA